MDQNKRTHREKFNEHMDEVLDSFPIESTMETLNESIVTEKELEHLDQHISHVLHEVRKRSREKREECLAQKKK